MSFEAGGTSGTVRFSSGAGSGVAVELFKVDMILNSELDKLYGVETAKRSSEFCGKFRACNDPEKSRRAGMLLLLVRCMAFGRGIRWTLQTSEDGEGRCRI